VGEHLGGDEGEDSRRVYFLCKVSTGRSRKEGTRGVE